MYAPFNVQLVVTRQCNLSCSYCNEYNKDSQHVSFGTLKERIDKLHALGTFSLTFTGGEPLLHPDIFKIVSYAKKRIPWVTVITNAYLLNEEKIRVLNSTGLDYMMISVDGVKASRFTVKALDSLRNKLELLASARFTVIINSVLGSSPPEEVREVLSFCRRKGFKTTVGLIHGTRGELTLPPGEREKYISVIRMLTSPWYDPHRFELKLLRRERADFKCRAGSRYLYVGEDGNVYLCSQTRSHPIKPLDHYGLGDLKQQFHSGKPCSKLCTIGCVRRSSLPDFWRSQNNAVDDVIE